MKTFLRENKLGLIFLGLPVLGLMILSNINFYQIQYDRTPWVELGTPPSPVKYIMHIGFSKVPSNQPNPAIYVVSKDINTYRCCSADGWQKSKYPTYNFSAYAFTEEQMEEKAGTPYCGNKIEQEWEIKQESERGTAEDRPVGICDSADSYEYAVIQLKEDGTIREKYVDGRGIYRLREKLSSFFSAWFALSVLVLVVAFIKRGWQGLKTRWHENKVGWLLLSIPVLCLVLLWNTNIYKIWYDNTPWKSLGSPPSKAVKIFDVDFQYSPYNSKQLEQSPEIEVYAKNFLIYSMNWKGQWDSGRYPNYLEFDRLRETNLRSSEIQCITKIQMSWQINEEQDQNASLIDMRGSCAHYSFDSDRYVVFKIMQNGDIWEKYVNGEIPRNFRKWTTFYLCLFLILSAPIWTRLFIDFDFLKLKPDYDAK